MVNINDILKELIKLHDCVIFPNLGGFVGQYAPAKLNSHDLSYETPYKQILFNKNLVNNDGLLANAIAKKYNLSYDIAQEEISVLLIQIRKDLKLRKKFSFDGIGILYEDKGILNFKQKSENLLIDSYGLKPINMSDFTANSSEAKVLNINSVSSKKNIKNLGMVAGVLILLFYSAWIPLKTDLLNGNESFKYSDLNPFTFNKSESLTTKTKSNTFLEKEDLKTEKSSEISFIKSKAKEKSKDVVLQPKNIAINNPIKVKSFEVIIGSFRNQKNAKKLIKTLQKKSLNARELPFENNLFRVSVGKFSNRKNAIEYQKIVKKKLQFSSWVLTK
jgi:cell division septation protein DedD